MTPPLLNLRDIELNFGGAPLLEGASLTLSEGDRLCLVGRNGSGKSTLLKIAAGLIDADEGERFVQPGTSVRYLEQTPDLSGYATALDYVEAGFDLEDDNYRGRYMLDILGVDAAAEPSHLSGGETRRCALARTLAPEPDILLLDEPTNHLDLPAIEWLEGELKSLRSALVLISHDRRFLETLSRSTVWIDRGSVRRLEAGFGSFEAWRDEILEQEQTERHKLNRKIVRETHWLIHGVTARRKRNQGRLRDLNGLRKQRSEQRQLPGSVKMAIAESDASSKRVIEAKCVSKSFGGGSKPIISNVSLRILRGDRLGVIGPNGSGKTTLLNLLTGTLAPDQGTVKVGTTVEVVTLDQKREHLDLERSLSDTLTNGSGDTVIVAGQPKHIISYMKDFLFLPEQAGTPVGELSGGERGRLMLALALARPSNLLVLDEPTNDLDLETLDLLQEMLAEYPGTVLLVSHDRDFLDRVASSVVASEGDGRWLEYAGGYSDMIAQRRGETINTKIGRNGKRKKPGSEFSKTPEPRSHKLSFIDSHALKTLPDDIKTLEVEIAIQQKTLADPTLYASDPATFDRTAAALKTAETRLDEAEEKWLALEVLREEVEGD